MKLSENYKLAMEAGYEKARKEFLEIIEKMSGSPEIMAMRKYLLKQLEEKK